LFFSYYAPLLPSADHFVVLLMENRAADHVFGCMGINGFDGIPSSGRMLWKNASDHAQGGINVSCGTAAYACHESMGYPTWDAKFKPGADRLTYPYGEQSDDYSYQAFQSKKVPNGGASVKMFSREQLPVKAALADNFRAFNKLYSGAPASSTPNHDFVQSATSCGLRDNRNYRDCKLQSQSAFRPDV
jgi:phospholipase C